MTAIKLTSVERSAMPGHNALFPLGKSKGRRKGEVMN